MEGRVCNRCKEFKDWEGFAINSKGVNNRKSICKSCSNTANVLLTKRRKEENPEKVRHDRWVKHLKRSYGLSLEDYTNMLEDQNGVCLICEKKPEDCRDSKLFVDHCHTTLDNRGLLCYHCNTVLGMAHDKIEILQRCIDYLTGNLKKDDKNG